MGAKQSKRSVDISGKEAESAGEVAAAGAGGEGRVEPLADADALKPQLNGAAHIQPDQPLSDKEKQLDSGTPENEKDATTEKEGKEEQNEEKEVITVTNGDNETKEENGDPVPTPEDGKKPKKEKVKKKWSLRSISFSRKDKPKQEKKSKEEEPRTNGEPEKVPEEAAEAVTAVTEAVENKVAEVVKADAEVKEDKTPETPVTEPLTNGSSTPESPKVETLAADEPAAPAPDADQIQETPVPELKPEQLPVNGLSLEEPKTEAPEIPPTEEAKPVESAADATVTAPVPEIPVKTEVCDAKMPLIEPTPPPLPANPPPSSVASFAATTMAPELIEASLANTTENSILTPPAIPDTKADKLNANEIEPQQNEITNTDLVMSQLSPPLKETAAADIPVATSTEVEIEKVITHSEIVPESEVDPEKVPSKVENVTTDTKDETIITAIVSDVIETDFKESEVNIPEAIIDTHEVNVPVAKVEESEVKIPEAEKEVLNNGTETVVSSDVNDAIANCGLDSAPIGVGSDAGAVENEIASNEFCKTQNDQIPESTSEFPDIDELPPPPPLAELTDLVHRDDKEIEHPQLETITTEDSNADHHSDRETNGTIDETEQDKIINKKKDGLGNVIETIECNGNAVSEEAASAESPACSPPASLPPSPGAGQGTGQAAGPGAGPGAAEPPPPPAEPRLQDPLPIADKIADLIPEIPTVPELNTETELASQVAVAD